MWRDEKQRRQFAENEVERLKKEIPMIREDVQVELLQKDKRILDLETIDKRHQKQMGELIEDNKKLSKQIQDLDKVKELRSKGLI